MKLSNEQTTYIENYIASFDIKYYEIYMEILDHLILGVEAILEEGKTISFEDAVVKAKVEGFGKLGFRGMMDEKVKNFNARNRKLFNLQIKSYFNFPRIMATIDAFVLYFLLLSLFEKPQIIHLIVIISIVVLGILQLVPFIKYRKKESLYVLKTESFFLYFNLLLAGTYVNNGLVLLGKEIIDFNSLYIKFLMSIIFTYTLLSYFVFMKIRKTTLSELKQQIFA
jgi:hypothetical protein